MPPTRRSFLTGATAVAATAAVTHEAHADPSPRGSQVSRYAFITDAHINVGEPESSALLRTTMAAIERDRPELVINAGDMTDFGAAAEYAAYLDLVPDALTDRLCHVPGNHERKWDWAADETFVRYLGATSSSRTVDGLRFIMWDTSQHQQGGPTAPQSRLDWLAHELARGPHDQQSVIVTPPSPDGRGLLLPA